MSKTKIEWTQQTWNPMVGCSRVAKSNGRSGCDHCYAEGQVHRFGGRYDRPTTVKLGASTRPGLTFLPVVNGESLGKGARWTGAVWLLPDVLDVPLRRRKPTVYFVNSLSDVFHESVVGCEDGRRFIAAMFGVMAATPQHTYQVLTKRPEQAREWFAWAEQATGCFDGWIPDGPHQAARAIARTMQRSQEHRQRALTDAEVWPLPNVWLGTSVEDQDAADERIPALLDVPAAVRFLSVEPMLGPVDLVQWIGAVDRCSDCEVERDGIGEDHCDECGREGTIITTWGAGQLDRLRSGERYADGGPHDDDDGPPIDWVICGGESGHGARPMHPDWARSLRDQCVEAGVSFFFKQWGAWAEDPNMSESGVAETVWGSPARVSVERGAIVIAEVPRRGVQMWRVGKKDAGRELDGRTWDEMPGPMYKHGGAQ